MFNVTDNFKPADGVNQNLNVSLDPPPSLLAASTAQVVSCPPAERADPGLRHIGAAALPIPPPGQGAALERPGPLGSRTTQAGASGVAAAEPATC